MDARRTPRRFHGDGGYTLTELLATIAITTVILPTIAMALIMALRATSDASERFDEAFDTELVLRYFVPDAQSANIIGTNSLDTPCNALEQSNDLIRLVGLRFATGYRRVDLTPTDGVTEYALQRWTADLVDTNGDGTPECTGGRTQVVADQISNVTAFSDSDHQVALRIRSTSGHEYSVSASQRTGTVNLNQRPRIVSMVVNCHNLTCDATGSWNDPDGSIISAIWNWGDGSPVGPDTHHEYASPGGSFTVTLTVTDDAGADDTASQDVEVADNQPPSSFDDAYTMNEDSVLTVPAAGVLTNDTDPGGDPLIALLDTGPAHGSLTFNPDGSFVYTPAANYFGPDSFTYHATDIDGAVAAAATVRITVVPANDPPVAVSDAYTTDEDIVLDVVIPGVLTNDSDVENDPITAVLVAGPTHGSLLLRPDGSFRYTPALNYNGPDSFTYRANDGTENSNTTTVSLTVNKVNDGAPVSGNNSYSTNEDTGFTVPAPGVLNNDTDADGDPMTTSLVTGAANGSVTLNLNGSFTYIPNPNWFGTDTFTYQAHDGTSPGNTATVTIIVASVPDAPSATPENYVVIEDEVLTHNAPGVLGNDSDVDSPSITAVRDANVSHGTLVFNADGSFTYTPTANYVGPDSFTYHARDGALNSSIVTVNITVVPNPVNDLPTADNEAYTATEDTLLTVAPAGVLVGDTDVDGDPLTAVNASTPAHGTVNLNTNGGFTYMPSGNYFGPDSFTYQARDPSGGLSLPATVNITVNPVANDAPTAANDSYSTIEDTPLTVAAPGVLNNDNDPDQTPITAVLPSTPSSGTVTLNVNGSFTYTPALNFAGTATFTYRARSAAAPQDSNIATVTITVNPVLDPPTASADSYATNRNTTLTVPAPGVLTNDTDVDSPILTAVLNTGLGAGQGTLTLNPNGSFTYVPTAGFSGQASFTYRASDGTSTSSAVTVAIQVRRAPTATFVLTCGQPNSGSGGDGQECHTDITGFDADGAITGWSWNWGESPVDTTVFGSHNYSSDGPKTVILTVTDEFGQSSTSSKQVYVNANGLRVTDQDTLTGPARRSVTLNWNDSDFPFTGSSNNDRVYVYRCSGEVVACDDNLTEVINETGTVTNVWTTTAPIVTYRVCDTNTSACSNDVVVTYDQYELRLDHYEIRTSNDRRRVDLHWSGPDFRTSNVRLYRCTGPVSGCDDNGANVSNSNVEGFIDNNDFDTTADIVTYRLCETSGSPLRCSQDLVVVFDQ